MKTTRLLTILCLCMGISTIVRAQKSIPHLIIEAFNDATSGFPTFKDFIITENGDRQLNAAKTAEYSGAYKVYLNTYPNTELALLPGKKFTEYEMSIRGFNFSTPYSTWAEARDSIYDKYYSFYTYFETLFAKDLAHSKIIGQKIGTDDRNAARYKVFYYPKGLNIPNTDDAIEILRALGNTTYFTLEIWDVPLMKGKYYIAIKIFGYKEQT